MILRFALFRRLWEIVVSCLFSAYFGCCCFKCFVSFGFMLVHFVCFVVLLCLFVVCIACCFCVLFGLFIDCLFATGAFVVVVYAVLWIRFDLCT